MFVVKKILFSLFLLFIGSDETWAKENSAIWNGKADTKWYKDSESEFIITTPEQLAGFTKLVNEGNDFENKTIKLGASIILNDTINLGNWANNPPANEWTPIGNYDNYCSSPSDSLISFNGIFDGNGFAVSGVYINSIRDCQGFFGNVGSSGTIKKLGVVASYIKGENNIGGIVGYNRGGIVSGSYSTAWVAGKNAVGGLIGYSDGKCTISNNYSSSKVAGLNEVGGLIGYSDDKCTISSSYSSSEVSGKMSVGGLVGLNNGTISNSYYTGTVIGKLFEPTNGGLYVGGITGWNNRGTIINSYSIGATIGVLWVGGLTGSNSGTVVNSYSIGTVTGNEEVGGLTGDNSGTISNSYSASVVTGKSKVGGLAGNNNGLVVNSYYNRETSNQSKGKGISDKNYSKTTAEMRSKEFVDSLNFMAGLLSMNAWVYSPDKYPVLNEQIAVKTSMSHFFASGEGTETNPYMISTKKQLEYFSFLVNSGLDFLGKYLKLKQNITFNDTTNWLIWAIKLSANKWTPIGTKNNPFQGTFDGNGFAVSGIYINNYSQVSAGLFGTLGSSGTIKNLGVTSIYIKGGFHVGGLTGYNKGTIINSYSTGKIIVTKEYSAGGLVGCNCGDTSIIINGYSSALVSGQGSVGGLAGINSGMISDSYSVGKVSGKKDVGELVGFNTSKGIIYSSSSAGEVLGKMLIGLNYGVIVDSYYDNKNKNPKE